MRHPLVLLDLVLFIVTISGLALVPSTVIPHASWAVAFGAYHLGVYAIQLRRTHQIQSAEVGRLLAAVVFMTMAAAMAFGVNRPIVFLAIILGVLLVTGLAWAVYNAVVGAPKEPKD